MVTVDLSACPCSLHTIPAVTGVVVCIAVLATGGKIFKTILRKKVATLIAVNLNIVTNCGLKWACGINYCFSGGYKIQPKFLVSCQAAATSISRSWIKLRCLLRQVSVLNDAC